MDKRWNEPLVKLTIILIILTSVLVYFAVRSSFTGPVTETITVTTTTGMSTVYVTSQLETSYVTSTVGQPVTDPIAVVGLIAVGVVAALVAVLASRAFTRSPSG